MGNKAGSTRTHRPVVERWNSRLETIGAKSFDFASKTGEYKKVTKAFASLADACKVALDSLEELPSDFTVTTASTQRSWQVGDVCRVAEDVAPLYTVGPDVEMTVNEVHRIGGNADGKGSKIFVRCQVGKVMLTFPASHVE